MNIERDDKSRDLSLAQNEGFIRFQFLKVRFILVPVEPIILPPYKGSTLRGAFGHAFRKVVCIVKDKDCVDCLLRSRCAYSYIFETPTPEGTSRMKKYPYVPHPFVITPPLQDKRVYKPEEELSFSLTLIGRAAEYLPYFIYTFEELGRRGIGKGKGRYRLLRVEDGKERVIYQAEDKGLRGDYTSLSWLQILRMKGELGPQELTLRFLTPTRLKFNGRFTSQLEFHILIRNLLRRISLLAYFHCGIELDLDFREIIDGAKSVEKRDDRLRWYDWERYSRRQDVRLKMGGIVGEVSFVGELGEFLPFLLLGEQIHVGKGTSFGLGKYEIVR